MAKNSRKEPKVKRYRPATAQMYRLADKYLECFNGTEAAIFAGYAKASAHNAAQRVLNHPDIILHLKRQRKKLADKLEISAERVLDEIAAVAFANIRDYFDEQERDDDKVVAILKPVTRLTRRQASVISSMKPTMFGMEIKLHDKLAALDKLCRNLGLFKDHTGEITPDKIASLPPEALEQLAEQLEAHFVGQHTLH